VKVLAVDQTASADNNQPVVVHAVTLEVTPVDAEILLKGKTAGAIQLTLRNPLDESDARTPLPAPPKAAAIKAPIPVKPAVQEVMVLRGTQLVRTGTAAAVSELAH
jgi:pilus assembly protein CpaB